MGLSPGFSADITTGTDLTTPDGQMQVWHDIDSQRPRRLLLGPPCTWYSTLQNLNFHRWSEQQKAEKARVADLRFNFAVRCCEKQDDHGREFVLEHPASARRWGMPSMLALRNRPGVVRVTFDQCRLGLRYLEGKHLRKTYLHCNQQPDLGPHFRQLPVQLHHTARGNPGEPARGEDECLCTEVSLGHAACPPGGPLRGPGA